MSFFKLLLALVILSSYKFVIYVTKFSPTITFLFTFFSTPLYSALYSISYSPDFFAFASPITLTSNFSPSNVVAIHPGSIYSESFTINISLSPFNTKLKSILPSVFSFILFANNLVLFNTTNIVPNNNKKKTNNIYTYVDIINAFFFIVHPYFHIFIIHTIKPPTNPPK